MPKADPSLAEVSEKAGSFFWGRVIGI